MKILIMQPKRSDNINELKDMIGKHDCNCIFLPEGYIDSEDLINEACELAKNNHKAIVSSYLTNTKRKNRSILINERGEILFDREKSSVEGPLLLPSTGVVCGRQVGYMLCREIFLDYDDLLDSDIIFNPIGVGMFSEEQFIEWPSRARDIAISTNSILIGASHADGSYRNCGFSIPIAYVYDNEGNQIYLSKNDTRSVIVDLNKGQVNFI